MKWLGVGVRRSAGNGYIVWFASIVNDPLDLTSVKNIHLGVSIGGGEASHSPGDDSLWVLPRFHLGFAPGWRLNRGGRFACVFTGLYIHIHLVCLGLKACICCFSFAYPKKVNLRNAEVKRYISVFLLKT